MKKFKLLTGLLIFAFSFSNSYSQLANQNAYLFAHVDDYSGYSACWGYTAPDGREYAIIGAFQGTQFVDITDSGNVVEVGFVPTPNPTPGGNGWREMKVYSHYAYIVSEATNSGIQIVDLQYLPDSVHHVTNFFTGTLSDIHSISQSGPYIYINGSNSSFGNGVTVFDLTSNPEVPVQRGSWNTRYVHDCRIRNDTIWAMNIRSQDGQVTVIDATDKDNLTEITSWLNLPNPSPHNCDLSADRKYLFTTDEVGNSPPRLLKVWDVQDLTNPTQVATWQPTSITGSRVHNIERYGDYGVIAHYSAGIRIVDLSNPLSPTEVAWYDTYPSSNSLSYVGCWGVFIFPSGKIIGSNIGDGLYVIKTTFPLVNIQTLNSEIPEDYTLRQNYPNPFNPSTKINFQLPSSSRVSLKVYNTLGREVASLVDKKMGAGNYEYNFDAGKYGLTSGIYFYTLKTDDFISTKKMVLVK